jgi:hypothetical protein
VERKIGQFTKRIGRVLQILPAETFRDYFGTDNHRAMCEELNSSAEHFSVHSLTNVRTSVVGPFYIFCMFRDQELVTG